MRIMGATLEFDWLPFSPCWIPTLILLALILAYILLNIFKKKIVLDRSALIFIAEHETPIRELLQGKFGKRIEMLTTLAIFKGLVKEKSVMAKKAVWITKESDIQTFETEDLITWVRRHNAIIVTADLKKYRQEDVKVYYLTRKYELAKHKGERRVIKRREVPTETELIKLMKTTRRKLR